jgi:phage/plasmid-associated DNA primase
MLGSRDIFALADLENKDLNIDNELAGQTIKESAVLKRLTGGSRQHIRIQRKNEKAYDTMLYAKLFFNANAMPESADSSDAYNRRVVIIVFPNRFEGTTEDKQLISKLTTEEEKTGIFNILMAELRRIRHMKEIYVNEKTIEEKRLKYERAVHPIKAFFEEAVAEDSKADTKISKSEFHKAYLKYCKKYALPPEKYDYFCKILKIQFGVKETRVELKVNGPVKREMWWQGITLTEDYVSGTSQERLRPPWLP